MKVPNTDRFSITSLHSRWIGLDSGTLNTMLKVVFKILLIVEGDGMSASGWELRKVRTMVVVDNTLPRLAHSTSWIMLAQR